jgi:hypothetical protein
MEQPRYTDYLRRSADGSEGAPAGMARHMGVQFFFSLQD